VSSTCSHATWKASTAGAAVGFSYGRSNAALVILVRDYFAPESWNHVRAVQHGIDHGAWRSVPRPAAGYKKRPGSIFWLYIGRSARFGAVAIAHHPSASPESFASPAEPERNTKGVAHFGWAGRSRCASRLDTSVAGATRFRWRVEAEERMMRGEFDVVVVGDGK